VQTPDLHVEQPSVPHVPPSTTFWHVPVLSQVWHPSPLPQSDPAALITQVLLPLQIQQSPLALTQSLSLQHSWQVLSVLQQTNPDPEPQPQTPLVQQPPGQADCATHVPVVSQHIPAVRQETHVLVLVLRVSHDPQVGVVCWHTPLRQVPFVPQGVPSLALWHRPLLLQVWHPSFRPQGVPVAAAWQVRFEPQTWQSPLAAQSLLEQHS